MTEQISVEYDGKRYIAEMEREDDGGYSVSVPELPGCVSQGKSWSEAVVMIHDAIHCWQLARQQIDREGGD